MFLRRDDETRLGPGDDPKGVEAMMKTLEERLARYIPPRETWTPAEEALFVPADPLRVPLDEAQAMQLRAIKHTFEGHYRSNRFYRLYCEKRGFSPEDIRTYEDLDEIPLLPDSTFKTHPSGVDFAHWIANIFTGELPTVILKSAKPLFDEVINAFNAAGMVVTYSSGTSGRHTVIPRDMRTYLTQQYAHAKLKTCLSDLRAADHVLLFWPKWTETNLNIGRDMAHKFEMLNDLRYASDLKISADVALKAMTTQGQSQASRSAQETHREIMEIAMAWLECYAANTDWIALEGPPFLLLDLLEALERKGRRFDFRERGMIGTAGGWKVSERRRISAADFRQRVERVLGIPASNCSEWYGSVEMSGLVHTCREGHYFHVPYTWFKPLVLDSSLKPVGYGRRGRFAFLDGLATSYPGFIITGDEVRMLERCPVCDRPGPVLEPNIHRAPSVEMRGCAELMRRLLAQPYRMRSE